MSVQPIGASSLSAISSTSAVSEAVFTPPPT